MRTEDLQREIEHELSQHAKTNGNSAGGKKQEPIFVTMDTIEAEIVRWFWHNRIPYGRLTLVDGDPGAGKSFFTLRVSAAISRGDVLPGDKKPKAPGYVILLSIEDGFADTVRPRLDAMGADVSRVVIPNPKRGLAPSLMNASYIEGIVKDVGPALVVIDPIIAFSGKKDTDRASQVRDLLSPLMQLAERYSFACLLIRHLNKQGNTKALYRGNGSIDFIAACRSAFLVAEDPEEKGRRILAHVKNSLGPKQPSLSFYIDETGFRWGEEVDTTADDLLQPTEPGKRRERVQMDRAEEFLRDMLTNEPVTSIRLEEEAEKLGLRRAIWRAKAEMGIRATKGTGGRFYWSLPDGQGGSRG